MIPEDVMAYLRERAKEGDETAARLVAANDPDLFIVREIVAKAYEAGDLGDFATAFREGAYDSGPVMRAALAAYKAGRGE